MFDLKSVRWAMESLRAARMYPILLMLVGACGGQATHAAPPRSHVPSSTPSLTAPASPSAEATASTPVTIKLADSRYGRIIVDGSGRALYLFDADKGPTSTCYTACGAAWPPFIVAQAPTTGPDLAQALTSTTVRNDGSRQVTYNGHPLYYYIGDPGPGQVNCQAVVEFGGGWYVVDGQGNKISRA